MDIQELLDMALEQIRVDVERGDLTAIEELLKEVPEDALVSFLSENEVSDESRSYGPCGAPK